MPFEILKCGCSAQSVHQNEHDGLIKGHSSCIIHDCCEVVSNPSLVGRIAKCVYFGKPKPNRRHANDECNYGCRGNKDCGCGSVESDLKLAFFRYCPDQSQDEFFCGCHGWD